MNIALQYYAAVFFNCYSLQLLAYLEGIFLPFLGTFIMCLFGKGIIVPFKNEKHSEPIDAVKLIMMN